VASWKGQLTEAREVLSRADALLIGAGAGMGVDSGLPDFRGNQGFWKSYPPYAEKGLSFVEMANPRGFSQDPAFAWGFYGHRTHLYRDTIPHDGFGLLKRYGETLKHGSFVFTSNIDGHFQQGGFDESQVVECHGTLRHLQCTRPCTDDIWPADDLHVVVDMATMRAKDPLPECPHCGAIARPNVLMFGDSSWLGHRTQGQEWALNQWLHGIGRDTLVIIECGAGSAVPTVRYTSEQVVQQLGGHLIRINPREYDVPPGQFSFANGAKETLHALLDEII
jgi:NAD-dependent SIR2 family protein deacetylase